jgi:hypothetical protein
MTRAIDENRGYLAEQRFIPAPLFRINLVISFADVHLLIKTAKPRRVLTIGAPALQEGDG